MTAAEGRDKRPLAHWKKTCFTLASIAGAGRGHGIRFSARKTIYLQCPYVFWLKSHEVEITLGRERVHAVERRVALVSAERTS